MNRIINTVSSTSIYLDDIYLAPLKKLLKKFSLDKTLDENIWNIPTGTIGHINLDGMIININPNISYLDNFDYLRLIQQNNTQNNNDGYLNLDSQNESFEDSIITLFINYLEQLIKEGIPKKYQLFNVDTKYIKGNINFESTYKNYLIGENNFVNTEVEKLNINHFEAIVIKAAYIKVCSINSKYKKAFMTSALASIKQQYLKRVKTNHYIKSKRNYNSVLIKTYELAEIILNDLNSLKYDGHNSTSLILNSNQLFEDFVSNLLVNSFPKERFALQQEETAAYYNEKQIIAKPDILYLGPEKIVLDVKNKNFRKAITSDNYHQMISYMHTYKIKTGVLIYPNNEDEEDKLFTVVSDEQLKLYAVSINIKKQNFKPFIDTIASIIQYG